MERVAFIPVNHQKEYLVPVTLFIVLAVAGALALLGFSLFGIGSPDRSDQPPPHLPGHDYLDYLKKDEPKE